MHGLSHSYLFSLSKVLVLLGIWALIGSCTQETDANSRSGQKLEKAPIDAPVSVPASEKVSEAELATDAAKSSAMQKTVHTNTPPKEIEGMVFVPGGELELGSIEGLPREKPTSQLNILPFYMDKTPVTVGQYRKFVKATQYVTEAEKFGNSIVHDMSGQQAWHFVQGANWQFPRGPKEGPAPDDHPVTQVSFNDALAYCKWAGKRLPTEAEWEHAARNGENSRKIYSWGDEIKSNGIYKANYWQGSFPYLNEQKDGYLFTSPVGSFGYTPLGLADMAGNVWEWCDDWYKMYGPNGEYIESTPGQRERVMRGGSFMCEPGFCHGYRVSGRSGTTPESALFHLGFRCVKDIDI